MTLSLNPGSAIRDAPRCSADELRALLRRGNLTGSAAARIAGVNPRTIRRWIGGDSEIPCSAWRAIQQHIDSQAVIQAVTPDERFRALKRLLEFQYGRVCDLEHELCEARMVAAETQRQMNQAAAQRPVDNPVDKS